MIQLNINFRNVLMKCLDGNCTSFYQPIKLVCSLSAGPPETAMLALGDKIASNIVAETAGIPTLPWSGSGRWLPLAVTCHYPDHTF